MTHPDQKTLELFVLGDEIVSHEREELERHLSLCEGCRVQFEEMVQFYRGVRVAGVADSGELTEAKPLLLAQPGFVVPGSRSAMAGRGAVGTLWQIVREHPRVSVGLVAAGIAVAALLILYRTPQVMASAHLNIYRQRLEIFDQRDKPMWEVPVAADSSILYAEGEHSFRYMLSDITGDRGPELITTLSFVGDERPFRYTLRLLDGKGDTVWTRTPCVQVVNYSGVAYDEWYGHSFFAVSRNAQGTPVIAAGWSGTRSPCAIIEYAPHGQRIGEYWHFGQLKPVDSCDIDGDGISEIVVIGTDQGADDNLGRAVVVFLKPDSIRGKSRSVLSPGFDMPASMAEVAYVRFPLSDMNRALHCGAGTVQFAKSGDLLHFIVASTPGGASGGYFSFEYILDASRRPVDAKWDENARSYHSALTAKGLIHSRFDFTYKDTLRRSVQFYNGQGWQDTPTTIQH